LGNIRDIRITRNIRYIFSDARNDSGELRKRIHFVSGSRADPTARTRIGEVAIDANPAGWPVDDQYGILQLKKKFPPPQAGYSFCMSKDAALNVAGPAGGLRSVSAHPYSSRRPLIGRENATEKNLFSIR
jgi:hypothetical protein